MCEEVGGDVGVCVLFAWLVCVHRCADIGVWYRCVCMVYICGVCGDRCVVCVLCVWHVCVVSMV